MGDGRAEDAEDREKRQVRAREAGEAAEEDGKKGEAGEEVLVEGDAQTAVPSRKPPVQDGQDSEGPPERSPQRTPRRTGSASAKRGTTRKTPRRVIPEKRTFAASGRFLSKRGSRKTVNAGNVA